MFLSRKIDIMYIWFGLYSLISGNDLDRLVSISNLTFLCKLELVLPSIDGEVNLDRVSNLQII